tara:strand:- start:1217 stop:1669 length:453 start_codon:yes stop_codon:yes gene_type:complete
MSEELINKIKEYIPDFNGYSQENFIESESSIRKKSIEELQIGMNLIKEQLNNNKLNDIKKSVGEAVIEKFKTSIENLKKNIEMIDVFSNEKITDLLTQDINLITKSIAIKEKAVRVSREIPNARSWDNEIDELYNKFKELSPMVKKRTNQ